MTFPNNNPVTFDPTYFRLYYPAFSNETTFPDATLQQWFNMGTGFISTYNSSSNMLNGLPLVEALNLMTAHIGTLFGLIAAGQTPGFETEARIDKIAVSVQPPPAKSQFLWWLNTTPYGSQLAALLSVASVSGFYVGGNPERSAFRRVYGGFNSGGWN